MNINEKAKIAALGAAGFVGFAAGCMPLQKYDMVVVDEEGAFHYFTPGMNGNGKSDLLLKHGYLPKDTAKAFYGAQINAQKNLYDRKLNAQKDILCSQILGKNKKVDEQTKQISDLEGKLEKERTEHTLSLAQSGQPNFVSVNNTDYTTPSIILGGALLAIAGLYAFRDKILKYVPYMNK